MWRCVLKVSVVLCIIWFLYSINIVWSAFWCSPVFMISEISKKSFPKDQCLFWRRDSNLSVATYGIPTSTADQHFIADDLKSFEPRMTHHRCVMSLFWCVDVNNNSDISCNGGKDSFRCKYISYNGVLYGIWAEAWTTSYCNVMSLPSFGVLVRRHQWSMTCRSAIMTGWMSIIWKKNRLLSIKIVNLFVNLGKTDCKENISWMTFI